MIRRGVRWPVAKSTECSLSRWMGWSIPVLVAFSAGFALGETVSSDPSRFLGTLLRKHRYLFEEGIRGRLESLNRDLREAAKDMKPGPLRNQGSKPLPPASWQDVWIPCCVRFLPPSRWT